MSRPHVSVVIPTRDRPEFLRRAVRSALGQQGTNVDVIIVDDASRSAVGNAFGRTSDVTVLRRERSAGMGAARNCGWRAASGSWVAFLDDDDLWAPTKLAELLDAAAECDAAFAYSSAVVVDAALRPIGFEAAPEPSKLLRELLSRCVMPGGTSNAIVRRDLLDEVDGFDETFALSGDWDLWIRLAQRARPAAVDRVLVAYLHHRGSWSLVDEPGLDKDLRLLAERHRAVGQSLGVQLDARDYGRYIANRLLRGGQRRRAAIRYWQVGIRHRDPPSLLRAGAALVWPLALPAPRRNALPKAPDWLRIYDPFDPTTDGPCDSRTVSPPRSTR